MKYSNILLYLSFLILIISCQEAPSTHETELTNKESSREFYQIKTYIFDNDVQINTTEIYLKNALLPALHRQGIQNIGVFKPRPNEEDTIKKLLVLIPLKSLNQFVTIDELLAIDNEYIEKGASYLNATYDNPPYRRIKSVLLRAFIDMPFMKVPKLTNLREERVYELRSYESSTENIYWNKVDMFNAGGEVDLFESLEFNAIFYGEVLSGNKMPNLMYMTSFSDQKSRDEHWKAFVDSPKWKELIGMEKYKNNISHIDKYFLYPTEYSDY